MHHNIVSWNISKQLQSATEDSTEYWSSTSFPLVSLFSYHSTVTLFDSKFTPLIIAEWTRPG